MRSRVSVPGNVGQEHENRPADDRVEALLLEIELLRIRFDELDVAKSSVPGALTGKSEKSRRDVRTHNTPLGTRHARGGKAGFSISTADIQDRRSRSNACQRDKLRAVTLAAVLAFDYVVPLAPSSGGIIPFLTRLLLKGCGIKGLHFCHAEFLSCGGGNLRRSVLLLNQTPSGDSIRSSFAGVF
jgi:hypothetical protein